MVNKFSNNLLEILLRITESIYKNKHTNFPLLDAAADGHTTFMWSMMYRIGGTVFFKKKEEKNNLI